MISRRLLRTVNERFCWHDGSPTMARAVALHPCVPRKRSARVRMTSVPARGAAAVEFCNVWRFASIHTLWHQPANVFFHVFFFSPTRLRVKRSASAERRRGRTLAASEKTAAGLREARRGVETAAYRHEVGVLGVDMEPEMDNRRCVCSPPPARNSACSACLPVKTGVDRLEPSWAHVALGPAKGVIT